MELNSGILANSRNTNHNALTTDYHTPLTDIPRNLTDILHQRTDYQRWKAQQLQNEKDKELCYQMRLLFFQLASAIEKELSSLILSQQLLEENLERKKQEISQLGKVQSGRRIQSNNRNKTTDLDERIERDEDRLVKFQQNLEQVVNTIVGI